MAKTYILKPHCPKCGKPAVVANEVEFPNATGVFLRCGHHLYVEREEVKDETLQEIAEFCSKKGDHLYKFQQDAVKFGIDANFRALYALEMRLGKTPITCCLLKLYKKKLCPSLIICKATLTIQWWKELYNWSDYMSQLLDGGNSQPFPEHFDTLIVSMDTIRNVKWLDSIEVKSVIIDECQHFKNTDASRTKALQRILTNKEYLFHLSGTPIKNHAGEFFVTLNSIDPMNFRSREGFYSRWIETYWDGYKMRTGGINKYREKEFHEITKKFILRMTREEVAPDLPKVRRTFQFVELGKQEDKALKKEFENYLDIYYESEGGDKLGHAQRLGESINRMRQIVAYSKIDPTVEFICEFLESTNGEKKKIIIFTHHIQPTDLLESKLNEQLKEMGLKPASRIKGGMPVELTVKIEDEIRADPDRRVLIASTLASGEGKTFDFCANLVMMERQWNPANEEQAEARPISVKNPASYVDANYMIVEGSVDDILTQVVEEKRQNVAQAMGDKVVKWQESDVMRELQSRLAKQGGKRWGI